MDIYSQVVRIKDYEWVFCTEFHNHVHILINEFIIFEVLVKWPIYVIGKQA